MSARRSLLLTAVEVDFCAYKLVFRWLGKAVRYVVGSDDWYRRGARVLGPAAMVAFAADYADVQPRWLAAVLATFWLLLAAHLGTLVVSELDEVREWFRRSPSQALPPSTFIVIVRRAAWSTWLLLAVATRFWVGLNAADVAQMVLVTGMLTCWYAAHLDPPSRTLPGDVRRLVDGLARRVRPAPTGAGLVS